MAAVPKPDEQLTAALGRLADNFDFKRLVEFIDQQEAYLSSSLVNESDIQTIYRLQGRLLQTQALLKLMKVNR